jgi:hypothetical protein
MDRLEYILKQSDLTVFPGEVLHEHKSYFVSLSKQSDFVEIIKTELEKAITESRINRFIFISHVLEAFGNNSDDHQSIYVSMIDFINAVFSNENGIGNEMALDLVLDLFWHQDNGLKNLNYEQQLKLNQLLKVAANHKYEIDDDMFFGIAKSMDLIKFQKLTGDAQNLIDLYLNHFDDNVKQRAIEYHIKGWI